MRKPIEKQFNVKSHVIRARENDMKRKILYLAYTGKYRINYDPVPMPFIVSCRLTRREHIISVE